MICPKCGFELADGLLYCGRCGEEIQIVPDFEPEIENSMIETLSTVAEEIGLDRQREHPFSDEAVPAGVPLGDMPFEDMPPGDRPFANVPSVAEYEGMDLPKQEENPPAPPVRVDVAAKYPETARSEEKQGRTRLMISIASFVGVVVLLAIVGIQMYHVYSVPYQITKAGEAADSADYKTAADYMARADALSPENADIRYSLATYHYMNQEPDKAVSILVLMTQSDRYTVEEKERCYDRAITILDEQGKYQEISDLLQNCNDEALVTRYQSYLAMEPEFSVAAGNYEEVIPLKLNANTSGKIYYTLNGSKPNRGSKVYSSPIFLETGEYIVSAIFINNYGIESEIVRNTYHIDLSVPDPPQVALYSGLYVEPTMIEVTPSADGQVYYTENGRDPTIDSTRYTGPIPMPLGHREYRFVTISEEGVSSEVITRNYEFRLMTNITQEQAIRNIMQALLNRQVLIDMSGKAFGMEGEYEYSYADLIEIPEKGLYYKIDEYYQENGGIKVKTEHLYAVEVYTGAPNRLIYNEQGEMDLISLD